VISVPSTKSCHRARYAPGPGRASRAAAAAAEAETEDAPPGPGDEARLEAREPGFEALASEGLEVDARAGWFVRGEASTEVRRDNEEAWRAVR